MCPPSASTPEIFSYLLDNSTVKHISLLIIFLRKEVIQPHLPIRLPCYDFTPVIGPTFDGSFLSVRSPASGVTDSHHVIVCINKIDRPEARPDEVIDEVLELLMDLDASDEQLDCPFLYASAKAGHAVLDLNDTPENMEPLFETILKYIPAPEGDPEAGTQVLI